MASTMLDIRSQPLPLPTAARYLMALGAVLAPALTAVGFLLDSGTLGLEDRDLVQHIADRLDAYASHAWLSVVAAALWAPAILVVGRVARARAPIAGLVGFVLAFALVLPSGLDPYELAHVGLASGLDVDATLNLLKASDSVPSAALGWTWPLGLIGLIVLGVAILQRRSGPAWLSSPARSPYQRPCSRTQPSPASPHGCCSRSASPDAGWP